MRGRFRDPLVGRDVLLGVTVALAIHFVFLAPPFLAEHVFSVGGVELATSIQPSVLMGTRAVFASIFHALDDLNAVFGLFVLLLLFRMLTRRILLAAVLAWVLVAGVGMVGDLMSEEPYHALQLVADLLSLVILITSIALGFHRPFSFPQALEELVPKTLSAA